MFEMLLLLAVLLNQLRIQTFTCLDDAHTRQSSRGWRFKISISKHRTRERERERERERNVSFALLRFPGRLPLTIVFGVATTVSSLLLLLCFPKVRSLASKCQMFKVTSATICEKPTTSISQANPKMKSKCDFETVKE